MKISVKILPSKSYKEININPGLRIYDLIKEFQLKPDSIIVLEDNNPIPVDNILSNGQKITLLKVASGG